MPTIFRKGITTASVKKKLLEICGSEDGFWKVKGLDWSFVKANTEYFGPLDLSQQIAFLGLGLERLKGIWAECRDDWFGEDPIKYYLAKIDAQRIEKRAAEQRIREAEVGLAVRDVYRKEET